MLCNHIDNQYEMETADYSTQKSYSYSITCCIRYVTPQTLLNISSYVRIAIIYVFTAYEY